MVFLRSILHFIVIAFLTLKNFNLLKLCLLNVNKYEMKKYHTAKAKEKQGNEIRKLTISNLLPHLKSADEL